MEKPWYICKWDSGVCLHQCMVEDNNELTVTYIYPHWRIVAIFNYRSYYISFFLKLIQDEFHHLQPESLICRTLFTPCSLHLSLGYHPLPGLQLHLCTDEFYVIFHNRPPSWIPDIKALVGISSFMSHEYIKFNMSLSPSSLPCNKNFLHSLGPINELLFSQLCYSRLLVFEISPIFNLMVIPSSQTCSFLKFFFKSAMLFCIAPSSSLKVLNSSFIPMSMVVL